MAVFLRTVKLGRSSYCDIFIRTITKRSINWAKLAEVGKLESPKFDSKYETGQLFLHRIFGYRGVVLFPWEANVYDRDVQSLSNQKPQTETESVVESVDSNASTISSNTNETPILSTGNSSLPPSPVSIHATTPTTTSFEATSSPVSNLTLSSESESTTATNKDATQETKCNVHTFYQVLIDSRDCPFIRAQTEAVTFLGNKDSNRSLYAIPGLDYVAHDDIMPYTSTEKVPLHHELFEKFLTHVPGKDPPFEAQDTLKAWQEKNHPWLELSDVHKETTEGIRVTVIPFYMGCRETPASSVYWWRYCIRLENMGVLSVQLRERHWRIFSLSGTLETVRGRGVVGQEPILSPSLPAFQYSSHVSLQAPSGHMWGTFRLEREDGHTFDCKIPPFSLESKQDDIPAPQKNGNSQKTPQTGDGDVKNGK